jgi:hypothetical protein
VPPNRCAQTASMDTNTVKVPALLSKPCTPLTFILVTKMQLQFLCYAILEALKNDALQ